MKIAGGLKLDSEKIRVRSLIMKSIHTENPAKAKAFCEKTKSEQNEILENNKAKCQSFLDAIKKSPDQAGKGNWKVEEASLILKSKVICTTLSMAGIERLEALKGHVDYLIVDEACQAIEPSCLIPFELDPKRVILVGD